MIAELLSIEDELINADELSQDPNKLVIKLKSAELFSIEDEFMIHGCYTASLNFNGLISNF